MENEDELPPPPPYSAHDPHGVPSYTNPTTTYSTEKKLPNYKDEKPRFVSGAAYFAMHASSAARLSPLLTYHVPILRYSKAKPVSFPGAKSIMQERDLTYQDWEAFLNHLILQQPKSRAAGSSRDPNLDEESMERESTRCARINAVTREWNEGFFGQRGVHIIPDIELFLKQDTHVAGSLFYRPRSDVNAEHEPSDVSIGLALYHAASKGNAILVQRLLDGGANANIRPSCAKPAITRAVENGDWHIVQMLLERGRPDLELTAPAGETALYAAVSQGNDKMVDLLQKYSADVSAKPPGGEPALYKAASKGFTTIVQNLLECDNIDIEATPPGGSTPLYRAYEKGNISILNLLLRKGANPNSKPPGGSTAMYKAAGKGDLEMTRTLLEYGADPDATLPGGGTALFNAASKGPESMARLLVNYGADVGKKPSGSNSALWVAAEASRLSLVRLLLDSGAAVDAATGDGNTALWRAAKRGDLEVARLLLEYYANPDETTMGNETALMIAASKGNVQMVRLLVDYCADPHKKIGSETPLSRAARKGHHDVVEMLVGTSASGRDLDQGYSRKI